jgi:hypothetical protein
LGRLRPLGFREAGGEGALVQRLGLRVEALVVVEPRQVVEAGSGVEVVGSQRFFANGEGAPAQWLGFRVPRAVNEIVTALVEKTGCCHGV